MSVLAVGIVCLDELLMCSMYPPEDELLLADRRVTHKGGNAANALGVLGQLAQHRHLPLPSLLSTLGTDNATAFVEAELQSLGCQLDPACPRIPSTDLPMSWIICSAASGSRTIVHLRNLRELSLSDFLLVDFDKYNWIHFEGRHVEVFATLMQHAYQLNQTCSPAHRRTISLELETPRQHGYDPLLAYADIVFISKEYARCNNCHNPHDALAFVRTKVRPEAVLFCPWGDQGADAQDQHGHFYHSDVFSPPAIIDSNGAGDTFIGSTIFKLWSGASIQEALTFGCRVAGKKVGQESFGGLGTME